MRRLILMALLSLIVIFVSGCFRSSSNNNPVGPVITSEESAPTGNASLGFRIILPDANGNPVALNNQKLSQAANSYLEASLYLTQETNLTQKKQAAVTGSEANLSFNAVPENTQCWVTVKLFNCNIQGETSFKGSGNTNDGVINVSPALSVPVLTYKGQCGSKVTFDNAGNPMGSDVNRKLQNYVTKQEYFSLSDLDSSDPQWQAYQAYWANDKFLVLGDNKIYSVDAQGNNKTLYAGVMDKRGYATDSADLLSTKLWVLEDAMYRNGVFYFINGYQQLCKIENNKIYVVGMSPTTCGNFVVTQGTGEIFFVGVTNYATRLRHVAKLVNGNPVKFTPDFPKDEAPNAMIAYKNGYLVATNKRIIFVNADGSFGQDWLTEFQWTNPSNNYTATISKFHIYKNAQGKIWVTSGTLSAIWEVQE